MLFVRSSPQLHPERVEPQSCKSAHRNPFPRASGQNTSLHSRPQEGNSRYRGPHKAAAMHRPTHKSRHSRLRFRTRTRSSPRIRRAGKRKSDCSRKQLRRHSQRSRLRLLATRRRRSQRNQSYSASPRRTSRADLRKPPLGRTAGRVYSRAASRYVVAQDVFEVVVVVDPDRLLRSSST